MQVNHKSEQAHWAAGVEYLQVVEDCRERKND